MTTTHSHALSKRAGYTHKKNYSLGPPLRKQDLEGVIILLKLRRGELRIRLPLDYTDYTVGQELYFNVSKVNYTV